MDQKKKTSHSKSLKKGIVVSAKMDKTIVVKVDTFKKHPKYQKRFLSSKKYKVHDPGNKYREGDTVFFQGSRPFSRGKRWVVVEQS